MWRSWRRASSAASSKSSSSRCRSPPDALRIGSIALKSGKSFRHNMLVTIPAGTLVPRDARDFGSYQLLAKLATGGMAEIYLARPARSRGTPPSNSDDVMVLKRILPHLAEDDHFVTMFRDEADLASKLVHKN